MSLRATYLLFIFTISYTVYWCQNPEPLARYSFNNSSAYDEIGNKKAKLVGVEFAPDRFENDNHAIYLFGNEASYINLGSYAELKPEQGSISMWVKVENDIWSGKGHVMNPLIITKCTNENDFYESYVICYYPQTKKAAAWCTKDSLKQIGITSVGVFSKFKWHHVAITYDDAYFCFYIDGDLEQRLQKNFRSRFLNSDSVIVGITANKKNNRFLNATVDDIEFYNRVLSPAEINRLYYAPNPNRTRVIIDRVLLTLAVLAGCFIFYLLVRYQSTLKLKSEKKQLELENKLLETELRVNRALMSPHFIFNSLNALQHFILMNENEQAHVYLVKFSKLIRKVLESNMSGIISLEMEIELLKRYLEIESMRFEETIVYTLEVNNELAPLSTHIPVMMLQPFVENAIWHGLLKKKGEKRIDISFEPVKSQYVLCTIHDNGLGRNQSENLDVEKKSLATVFIQQRLDFFNKLYELNCSLIYEDNPAGGGTIVKILLPILSK